MFLWLHRCGGGGTGKWWRGKAAGYIVFIVIFIRREMPTLQTLSSTSPCWIFVMCPQPSGGGTRCFSHAPHTVFHKTFARKQLRNLFPIDFTRTKEQPYSIEFVDDSPNVWEEGGAVEMTAHSEIVICANKWKFNENVRVVDAAAQLRLGDSHRFALTKLAKIIWWLRRQWCLLWIVPPMPYQPLSWFFVHNAHELIGLMRVTRL